ncbi:MAG: MinD/ParA family protein [Candidatus Sericytochromatia bacterium]|nr:MinD/ParA family protein [Candidatus Sericytochromatia bacterium]
MSDQAKRLRELMRHIPKAAGAAVDNAAESIRWGAETEEVTGTPTIASVAMSTVPALPLTSPARVIVVTSGKGGVGKTNITVNLALALAKREKRTVLFDADLGMANVDVILGVSPKAHLGDVIAGRKSLDDVLLPISDHLQIVPGGSGIHELADLDQDKLNGFIRQMAILEDRADFILVDTGAGISRGVLNFVLAAHEVLVVTTPEPTAITDAYGLIKSIDQHNPLAQVRLIINMAESEQEARAVAQKLIMIVDRFLEIDVSFLTHIEKDPQVSRSVLQQQPFFRAFPYGPSTRRINMLASLLIDPIESETPREAATGFFARVAARVFGSH